MAAPRRVLLVANPHASRAREDGDAASLLERAGLAVEETRPDDPREIPERIRSARERVDAVVVAGGDGTLHRAAAALVASERALGILPLGTANDLARTLGLPRDPQAAAGVIARGQTRRIDLGRVGDTLFFNVASFGVSERVTRRLEAGTKQRWGVLSYPLSALATLRESRPFRVELDADGRLERLWAIQVLVGNGRHYGGGMTIDADARIDDGRLTVCAVEAQSLLGLARLLPHLWRGSAGEVDGARVHHPRRVRVLTSRRLRVSADGELAGHTPCSFEVRPRALEVFVPVPEEEGPP